MLVCYGVTATNAHMYTFNLFVTVSTRANQSVSTVDTVAYCINEIQQFKFFFGACLFVFVLLQRVKERKKKNSAQIYGLSSFVYHKSHIRLTNTTHFMESATATLAVTNHTQTISG